MVAQVWVVHFGHGFDVDAFCGAATRLIESHELTA